MKTKNMTTLPVPNSINHPSLRRGLLFIPFALCCFTLCSAQYAFGVTPPPDGGYAGANTAEGTNALLNLTSGIANTCKCAPSRYYRWLERGDWVWDACPQHRRQL